MKKQVLIYKEDERIKEALTALQSGLDHLTELYNSFKAVNICPTVEEMITFSTIIGAGVGVDQQKQLRTRLIEFVKDKVLDGAGNISFGGLSLDRAKIKEMLVLPDLDPIYELLYNYGQTTWQRIRINSDWYEVTNGDVVIADSAVKQIENRYTHYTTTAKGSEIAIILLSLAERLNEHDKYFRRLGVVNDWTDKASIAGIEIVNNTYRPELLFIRQKEAVYKDK